MTEHAKPGQYLQYEREKRGISVEDVARALNLPVTTIVHLEGDAYDELPAPVYVRGYIRTYCSFLNVDSEAVLALNPDIAAPGGKPLSDISSMDAVVNERVQHLTRLWGSIVVLTVIVVLVFIWWSESRAPFGSQADLAPVQRAAPQTAPAVEPDAANDRFEAADAMQGEAAPQADLQASGDRTSDAGNAVAPPVPDKERRHISMTISASMTSWVLIHDGGRNKVIHRIVPVGYENHFDNLPLPMYFALGDARGIRLWFDGVEYDLTDHISDLNNTAFFHFDKAPGHE